MDAVIPLVIGFVGGWLAGWYVTRRSMDDALAGGWLTGWYVARQSSRDADAARRALEAQLRAQREQSATLARHLDTAGLIDARWDEAGNLLEYRVTGPTGTPSGEAVGAPTGAHGPPPPQVIRPGGVPSDEVVGEPDSHQAPPSGSGQPGGCC
jgi:hypothetical protein